MMPALDRRFTEILAMIRGEAPMPPDMLRRAEEVIARRASQPPVDIDAWAARLAADVAHAND